MCFVQVERWLCPNQCGSVVRNFDGTINVCEGQEAYHRTGDDSALEDCGLALHGTPDRVPYNAGFTDILCKECNMNEARELYQERRQMVYMAENREPPMATGWEQVPDWSIYQARSETMVPWWMFDRVRRGGEGL